MISYETYKPVIDEIAKSVGVEFLGVQPATVEKDFFRYKTWLDEGMHGEMHFLENHLHCRENPENLLDEAKSILLFAAPYGQKRDLSDQPKIAAYAKLKDYHKTLRKTGFEIVSKINDTLENIGDFRVTVDSAPILERALAARVGRGFIGKNTLFIMPDLGSYYILFEIITTKIFQEKSYKDVDHTKRGVDGGCGSCKRCQTHCPTGALDEAYRLDARKCLSYLTIEHRGIIPVEYWRHFRNTIFGCDICQNVCPYNRKTSVIDPSLLHLSEAPPLHEIVTMDQSYYEKTFGGTPTTRAKKVGLQRNALIAMVVLNDVSLDRVIVHIRRHDPHPLLLQTIDQIEVYRNVDV